jgi:hypothetical protein
VNRIDIEIALNRSRNEALEFIVALDDDELRAPRTRSEHDADSWWSYADHFIHTTLIERNFNAMVRRQIDGAQGMDAALVDGSGRALRPREEIMRYVHELTESWKVKQEGKTVDDLVRIGSATRADTLSLLAELDGDQLGMIIPGAPWSDGSIGGILAVHADHWAMHRRWAESGSGPGAEADPALLRSG